MKKSKKAKRVHFVQIPWRILDANLPPAAYYVLTRLWKMADWHTGRVPYTSAKDLETSFHKALSARTIQDVLKWLDDVGYITRLIPVKCSETYPIDISNYDAVDEKFRWKGVVNKRKVEVPVNVKELRPAKNAAPKDGPPANIAQGASVGASVGASDPPLQKLQTNQDSTSSTSKIERSEDDNKLLKAVSAVPPSAVVTASLLQTTAEEIASRERRLAGMVEANKRVLLKKDLEGKSIGSYRASLLLESVGEVLQDLRRSRQYLNMEEVYGQIADLWNRFRPDARWAVEFDADGNFALKAKGKKIRYAHLSGGEKTVLLVLARAILSKAVADIDFLLIDEPLEHLDVRNRRSLLNYLRGLALQRVIPQIVVTTFDETLTRHFRVASDVNLVFLGRQKPVFQA